MSTVFRQAGFRFFFFAFCLHERMHVHVENADGEVKIWLDTMAVEPEHGRMKQPDPARAAGIAAEIVARWRAEAARRRS